MVLSIRDIEELPLDSPTCQEWRAGKFAGGYGSIKIDGKSRKAHRYSYTYHKGDIPEGLCVRHICDNPSCVNPNHLLLGTHADNMRDKVERGRQWRGGHPNKLTEDQAIEMVSKYSQEYGQITKLANEYGLNRATVREYLYRAGVSTKISCKWPKKNRKEEMWEFPHITEVDDDYGDSF